MAAVRRWILQRVMDLGWTVDRFGEFDNLVNYNFHEGRSGHKRERIGKKYQWLAYNEILARAADSLEYRERHGDGTATAYEGPWQLHARDIDPSLVLSKTLREQWRTHSNSWWFPVAYDAWKVGSSDQEWLTILNDLPDVAKLVSVTNPEDRSSWLVLEGFYRWEQPVAPGEEPHEQERRDLWHMIKSYLVSAKDIGEMFKWAKKQNFMGRWMPESRDLYRVFLGEFFWSRAYKYHDSPYYGGEEWTRGTSNRLPKPVLVTSESYIQEQGGYDCSIDESISIQLPTKTLVEKMKLQWNGKEGCFFDMGGKPVAFDPSVSTAGPSVLLVRKESLLPFLKANNYAIFWTVLGEKNLLGPSLGPNNFKGRLEISGAGRLTKGKVEFVTTKRFEKPRK